MNKRYYKRYKLLKDIPNHKVGSELDWRGSERKFRFAIWDKILDKWDILRVEKDGECYTLEEVENNKEFFEPIGEPFDFYPEFVKNLKELKEYMYFGEGSICDDVDFARCLNDIIMSEEYEQKVFELIRDMYNKKYLSNK